MLIIVCCRVDYEKGVFHVDSIAYQSLNPNTDNEMYIDGQRKGCSTANRNELLITSLNPNTDKEM